MSAHHPPAAGPGRDSSPSSSGSSSTARQRTPLRTIAILGASYGGAHAAQMLAQSLPDNWRVVAIDRQSHMNHVYVFPRFILKPEYAAQGFVPYRNIFAPLRPPAAHPVLPPLPTPPTTPQASDRHVFLQGQILALSAHSVTVLLPDERGSYDGMADDGSNAPPERVTTVDFEYCIYSLGSMLPAPCDVWGEDGRTQLPGRGSKAGGIEWMWRHYEVVARAPRVCVVGAGALGIQFSSDIKDIWPDKTVTLIHSRNRVLPRYPIEMHDEMMDGLESMGVDVILGERVVQWPLNMDVLDGRDKTVVTEKGTHVTADLILACTGPKPHSALLHSLEPRAIAPNGRIRVKPTTQVDVPADDNLVDGVSTLSLDQQGRRPVPLNHMFAIGDCADTTAILAGHTAYWQGEVAARNIQRLIDGERTRTVPELEHYVPGAPAIKVTIGIEHYVIASGDMVTPGDDGDEDLQARAMWPVFNAGDCADDE